MGKIINHQRNRFKGYPYDSEQIKKELYNSDKFNCDIRSLTLDHIFLYCISENSWKYNLQLLKPKQKRLKWTIERKILIQLKKEGFTDSVTHYSLELLKNKEEVIQRFVELWKEETKQYFDIDFKTCIDVAEKILAFSKT